MPDPTRKTVSSTEAAALFGLSPWLTEFMLYQKLAKGIDVSPDESDRMHIGKLMQPVILQLTAEALRLDVQPWPQREYITNGSLGATLDSVVMCPTRGPGPAEVKNVGWLEWRQSYGFDEQGACVSAPPYYEIQLQIQMHALAKALGEPIRWGVLATLVGGNELVLLERVLDEELIEECEDRAAILLDRVRGSNEPDVEGGEDLDMLARLVPSAPEEPPLNLRETEVAGELERLAEEYEFRRQQRLAAGKVEDDAKAHLLNAVRGIGWRSPAEVDAGSVHGVILCDGGRLTISRGADRPYKLPPPVAELVRQCRDISNLDDDAEFAAAVAAVEAMEGTIARRGGLRMSWKRRTA